MSIPMDNPCDYGLPHDSWRTNQLESVQWALAMGDTYNLSTHQVGITCQPVGSGKTGFARALASKYGAMALCRTKNLQATVYTQYGFKVLYGRANYECVHNYAEEGDTAATCMYDSEGMDKCPYAAECPYLIAKEEAKRYGRASCNYAYYLTASWPKREPPMYLVCDEAHLLSDIVLDWVGCEIHMKDVHEFYLGNPPTITYTEGMSLFHHHDPCQQAVIYLRECIRAIQKQIVSLSKHLKSATNGPTVKKRIARAQNLLRSLQSTVQAIQANQSEWYIISGPGVIRGRAGPEPGFSARPLTARYHFPSLFIHSPVTIAMSGTIGDPKTFAAELGIKDYAYRSVPSNYPPETRPIQILDVPHLSYKSTEADYNHQADAIAAAILGCPKEWSGIIHTTRKKEGPLLADRLAHRGLQDRLFITPDGPTDAQMAAWVEHKARTNGKYGGQLCIAHAMTEGVDLVDERICIIAKCQYPDISDPYERARMNYSKDFFQQRTAWTVQQAAARTRRGFDEDYDLNGERQQLVCIADGSWVRLRKFFDEDFLQSIVDK